MTQENQSGDSGAEKTLGQIAKQAFSDAWMKTPAGTEPDVAERMAHQTALNAVREAVLEEAAKLMDNFSWELPLYEKQELNNVSDDAAESVLEQAAVAIRSLKASPRGEDMGCQAGSTAVGSDGIALCALHSGYGAEALWLLTEYASLTEPADTMNWHHDALAFVSKYQSSLEERGTRDEVDPASKSASLTHKTAEAP